MASFLITLGAVCMGVFLGCITEINNDIRKERFKDKSNLFKFFMRGVSVTGMYLAFWLCFYFYGGEILLALTSGYMCYMYK